MLGSRVTSVHIGGRMQELAVLNFSFFDTVKRSMDEKDINESPPPDREQSSEYGDALSDVLKDQVRRDELRSTATPKVAPVRVHPSVPPALALVSIWLWVFPPTALIPEVPTIPPAAQEAGLRMEMFIQLNNIIRYRAEHGNLPSGLDDLGDRPEGVQYTQLADDVFQLSGRTGDVTVAYTSTEPVEDLVADAMGVVSGSISSTPGGAGA